MKFSLSKIAVAAAALTASGYSFAVVDLDADTGFVNYAAELVSLNSPAPGGSSNTITDNSLDAVVDLGFGISNAQTRFLRFDLTNGTWNTGVNINSLIVGTISAKVVAQGGSSANSFVIFQITADTDYGPATDVQFNLGTQDPNGIDVLNDNFPVLLQYRQFGTATEAANQISPIISADGTLATFSPALVFSTAAGDNTASVASIGGPFRTFVPGDSLNGANTLVAVGTVTVGVNASSDKNGTPVGLDDLIDAGSKLVVTTTNNYTSLDTGGLFLNGNPNCTTSGGIFPLPSSGVGASSRDIVTNDNPIAGATLCYRANGTTPIEIQDFTVNLDVVPDPLSDTVDPAGSLAIGSFLHDGTTLKFPYAAGVGGTATFIQLANQGSTNALASILCYKTAGVPTPGAPGVTVNAGNTKAIGMASLGCAAGTTSVQVNLNVPVGTVIGSLVRTVNADGSLGLDGAVGNQ